MKKILSIMFISLAVLGVPAVAYAGGADCGCSSCQCQGECDCAKCNSK